MQSGCTKTSERRVKTEANAEAHIKSMTAQVAALLVFEVLPDSEDILSRTTEVSRKDALIRMREQIRQPLNLPCEFCILWRIELRRWASRPTKE